MNLRKHLRRIYKICVDFICRLMDDNAGVYAAQASFFVIISFIPFLMLLLSLVSVFFPINPELADSFIRENLPVTLHGILLEVVSEIFPKSTSATLVSITAISTLWLSSRGIMALYQGLNMVYHADIRNYFYVRALSVVYTLIFVIVLLMTMAVFAFGTFLQAWLEGITPYAGTVYQFILSKKVLIFLVILTLFFSIFYTFIPNCKPRLKFLHQVPGAFAAAAGWLIFSYIYSVYIENFSNYSYVYGSLTAIIFLMIWLYFCMNIFLFGAQLNKMIETHYFKTLFFKY